MQDDETTMLWSKLCFLAPFALATTATEGSLGVVRAEAGRWVRLEQCVNEAAKNERTASLYLDGLLDTNEHRRLEAARVRADLDLQHARREVERLHLIVRLVGTQSSEGILG